MGTKTVPLIDVSSAIVPSVLAIKRSVQTSSTAEQSGYHLGLSGGSMPHVLWMLVGCTQTAAQC